MSVKDWALKLSKEQSVEAVIKAELEAHKRPKPTMHIETDGPIDVLVMGDSHAHPDFGLDHFKWAGKVAADYEVDVWLDIGDSADLPSLCTHSNGLALEGQRVWRDFESYYTALELMSEADWEGKKLKVTGNHEHRLVRWLAQDPKLWREDAYEHWLKAQEHGWTVADFLQKVELGGVLFSHYFVSGVMGRAIGGENSAAQMLNKQRMSAVCGHSHLLDLAERTRGDGRKMLGLSVGCYLDLSTYGQQSWCRAQAQMWWSGLVILKGVVDGECTRGMTFLTYDEVRRRYG